MASIACSFGKTPEIAKKHTCITVLIRRPIPLASATLWASIEYNYMFLCFLWKIIPHFFFFPGGIYQESAVITYIFKHVILFNKNSLMACNKISFSNQI